MSFLSFSLLAADSTPLGWQAWFTACLVIVVFFVLAWGTIATDVLLLIAAVVLVAAGILTPAEAISGFSNEAVVMVGILFIVGAGVRETGAVDLLAGPLFGRPKTLTGAIARLTFPTAFLSAFMNNTPLVAMLIPAVSDFAKRQRIPASKLMIPLSYAAIFGGTCTLIGTSTNLVVQGQLIKALGEENKLGMFDIAWVGIPAAIVGCIYLIAAGHWLLPNRQPAVSSNDDPRQYTVEMLVERGSPLDGKTIEAAGLRHLPGVYLAEIERDGHAIPAVSPKEQLRGGDRLLFVGVVDSVVELQRIRGLLPASDDVFQLKHPRPQRCLVEAAVSNTYPFLGTTIRDSKFRSHYNAVVVAVGRNGERLQQKIGDIVLHPGDTLLVEAHPAFAEQHRNSRDFLLVSTVEESNPRRHELAWVSLAILLGMVALIAWSESTNQLKEYVASVPEWGRGLFETLLRIKLPSLLCAMLAGAAMVGMRCVSVETARKSMEWETLLAIAASFALGIAIQKTGLAHSTALLTQQFSAGNPWIGLAAIYFVTLLATELITNNAAAAIMFPFALSLAQTLGVSHVPFVIAIMMAASNGYATPIGYQTHLMVYGPGGYRFTDYLKVGIPLDILIGIVTILVTPIFFPFR